MKVKKNDCFLMKGSEITEPMTLYYVAYVNGDKVRVLSVYVGKEMIQGLEHGFEYDNDVSDDAIFMSPDVYDEMKEKMVSFLEKIKNFIHKNIIKGKFDLEVGGHYYHGYIYTIKEIGEKRVKCDLFRLEEENISPYWRAEDFIEDMKHYHPISEGTYQEVLRMYNDFVVELRNKLLSHIPK